MDALRSPNPPAPAHSAKRTGACDSFSDKPPTEGSSSDQPPPQDSYQESFGSADDLDEDEEQAEGERQEDELLAKYPIFESEAMEQLLDTTLRSLIGHCRRGQVLYEFVALDSAIPFASSCSHGAVYFTRGLLESLSLPSITFFGAHELAHTELRHYATRRRRLEELRRSIPAAPGSSARQRLELAAVLAVRHQEEFEADCLAARWLDFGCARDALEQMHALCLRVAPQSLTRPTHPAFERRMSRLRPPFLAPPAPIDYLWSLVGG